MEEKKEDHSSPPQLQSNNDQSNQKNDQSQFLLTPVVRERLLDRFPLTAWELERLVHFYQEHSTFLSSQERQGPELWWLIAESDPTALLCSKEDENVMLTVQNMLLWAMRTVFVMGFEDTNELQSLAVFLEAAVSLLGRRGNTTSFVHRALFYHHHSSENNNQKQTELLQTLVSLLQCLERKGSDATNQKGTTVPSSWEASLQLMAQEHNHHDTNVSWTTWNQWLTECAPWIYTIVPTLFAQLWFTTTDAHAEQSLWKGSQACPPWTWPQVRQPREWDMALPFSSSSSSLSYRTPLAAMLGPLNSHWYALYSSCQHGLSFCTLEQALLGYVGPTLLIFGVQPQTDDTENTAEPVVFAYYTQAPWRSNGKWHGHRCNDQDEASDLNDAFLCTLTPEWHMFARTFEESTTSTVGQPHPQIQCLSSSSSAKDNQNQGGLAVGGLRPEFPRLHVTESLQECTAVLTDQSFASGPLVPVRSIKQNSTESTINSNDDPAHVMFDVEWIDVYAIVPAQSSSSSSFSSTVTLDDTATTAATTTSPSTTQTPEDAVFYAQRAAGQLALDVQEGHRLSWAHVDRTQFVDDLTSTYTTSALFDHRTQARGRAAFVVGDQESDYYVEGKAPSHVAATEKQQQ